MAIVVGHGGGCCGVRHICHFTRTDNAATIKGLVDTTRQAQTQGMLVEAVLTNEQLAWSNDLKSSLEEVGFKCIARFRNPNSGNICNVFHYNKVPRGFNRFPKPRNR